MKLMVGSKTPDFTALDQNEKERTLSDYKGKWLLIYFYPKNDTPGCTKEACGIRDNYEDLKELVEIVGVSKDSVESHKKFAEKYELPFTLLSDPKREMIKAYEAAVGGLTRRISFLNDPGRRIVRIYLKVTPDKHAGEVIADLKLLRNSK